jgi:uncharacterized protein
MPTALELTQELLQNLTNPEVVRKLIADDAVYVSLNPDHPELTRILPWAGTNHGPDSFTDALGTMFTWWENQKFDVTDAFGDGDRAAVFGNFRYRSHTQNKIAASPFAILVRSTNGKISYLQFMEDTYATAASFRSDGAWTVHADPNGSPIQV